jgi:hypothetical protein
VKRLLVDFAIYAAIPFDGHMKINQQQNMLKAVNEHELDYTDFIHDTGIDKNTLSLSCPVIATMPGQNCHAADRQQTC